MIGCTGRADIQGEVGFLEIGGEGDVRAMQGNRVGKRRVAARGECLLRLEIVGRVVELVERHAVRTGRGEVGVDDEIDAFGAQVGGRDCAPFPVEEFLVLHRCEERGMPGRRLGVGAPYEGHGT